MKTWDELRAVFEKQLVSFGEVEVTPAILLTSVLIVLVAYGISRLLQRMLRRNVFEQVHLNKGSQSAICRLLHIIIMCIGAFIAIQHTGIDLTALAAVSAVLLVGIGLGLQNITHNFISGLIMLFERPVQEGDFVEVGGVQGTVQAVNAYSTKVETLDRVTIIVPNSHFLSDNVTNWSFQESKVRIHVSVGVSYGSDVELVAETLLEVGRAHPEVLSDPEPQIQFLTFGDSSLNFDLLVWIVDPTRQYFVISDLNFAIVQVFRERDIAIPFPQRDLHVRSAVPMSVATQSDGNEKKE
ncbi:MAG: mechanosensitive ion channel [Gemmatimonadetes bacterium]|nr:mechanosensitive ion channel [Gemmatimonadota bacterium]